MATANPLASGGFSYSIGIITFFRNAGRSVRRRYHASRFGVDGRFSTRLSQRWGCRHGEGVAGHEEAVRKMPVEHSPHRLAALDAGVDGVVVAPGFGVLNRAPYRRATSASIPRRNGRTTSKHTATTPSRRS